MRSVLSAARSRDLQQEQLSQAAAGQPQEQAGLSALTSTRVWLALTLVLSVFVVAPLFYPGYLQVHSGLASLWNLADLRANLGDPGWVPHIGLQFDPIRGDGLLFYYLAAWLPFTPVTAIKVVAGAAWLLGGAGMFLWLRSWLGNPGAFVAALVYSYLPYQIATAYVRGAWGEMLFAGLLPWALLAATYLVASPRLILVPVAALFWLGLGLSQLGLAAWALLFLILLLLIVHRPQALLPLAVALSGLALAGLIYLLILPQSLFIASPITFTDHFLYPFQLLSAYWGNGVSRPGWSDGISFQLGLAPTGLAIIGLYLWQRAGTGQPAVERTDRRLMFFAAGAITLILLQFSPAAVLWRVPIWPGQTLAATLSYPWQLLGLAGLCLSILAGAAVWLSPGGQFSRLPLLAALVMIVTLSVYPYLLPQFIQLQPGSPDGPEALLGQNALAILDHDFAVVTSGHTAGLEQSQTTIPLAVHGALQANDTLIANVRWQPLQPFAADLKVFVHLVDPNDQVLAQFDGQPQEGTHPTSQWIPGELIDDAYPLLFPAEAPPGPHRVFIGLYDEATLQRLPVPTDAEGRVILNVQ